MGNALLETLISATGLPEGDIHREIQVLLSKHNMDSNTLTMEDLREIMAEYLQDVLLSAKEGQA